MSSQHIDNIDKITKARAILRERIDPELFYEIKLASRSHYRLWWRCLKESEDYQAALEGLRPDPWASMAQDFGYLFLDFRTWWVVTGRHLFAEQVYQATVRELEFTLTEADEIKLLNLQDDIRPNLYVRIPLTQGRRAILNQLEKLIDRGLERYQREIAEANTPKRGFYPDQRIRSETIKTLLAVWRARKFDEDWYAIGERLKLRPEFNILSADDADTIKHKRRMMILNVQRYHKMANALIDFAAKGDFPRVK